MCCWNIFSSWFIVVLVCLNRAIFERSRSCFRNDVTMFHLHHTESPINQSETDAGLFKAINMHRLHRHNSRVRKIPSILISHNVMADNESRHVYVILLFVETTKKKSIIRCLVKMTLHDYFICIQMSLDLKLHNV